MSIGKYTNGVTLFEMILSIGIGSLLLMVLVSTIALMFESRIQQTLVKEVMESGTVILDLMMGSAEHASQITNPTKGESDDIFEVRIDPSDTSGNLEYFSWDPDTLEFIGAGQDGVLTLLNNDHVTITDFIVKNISQDTGADMATFSLTVQAENTIRPDYRYLHTFNGLLRVGYE